ncbi:DUF4349 domain-containing protein [Sphingobacterium paucimobilis]|uniref:DUF4349 domain-containing protein n=1 Tax=Sphingobacterium paucimobilis HER1398 TaxID=1346330 RepID=U2HEC8_9SPHI|nr:DUF4349 domain-containing protein [Sphingobacterium paucimobilis]ERJ60106.1 hypothetical protein M472_15180 [Sphingobacterium paucimobilis HER1398]
MNKITFLLALLSLTGVLACGQGSKEVSMESSADKATTYDLKTADAAATTAMPLKSEATELGNEKLEAEKLNQGKKIIRTGNISIESKDLKKSKIAIDALVKKANGYYEQESTTTGTTYTNYNLTLRIPSSQFDTFLEGIEKSNDKITEKSIHAQDVSLQYYDLESRVKSKRIYLARYQNMVANAKNVKELLEIEEQIRQLQEEIESTESALRVMKDQVGYSTLVLNLYNSDSIIAYSDSGFWLKTKEAFGFGWELIENIFIGAIGIWPILLLLLGTFIGWRRYKKHKRIQ